MGVDEDGDGTGDWRRHLMIVLCMVSMVAGALNRKGWKYGVDDGGGAFYGPKIDIKIKDAIGEHKPKGGTSRRP